jgi:hypothetical protein
LIRIFEYDAQIALDQDSEVAANRITVSFPHTAVLFLRSQSTMPDEMEVVIRTPGGEVKYSVPAMKVREYTIEEILAKKLLFLIPFYIFTYEPQFHEIDKSADRLAELTAEYERIATELEKQASEGSIDEFAKKTTMDMSERVLANLAKSYGNIRKGLGTVMGGKILDYEAKRIRNEGWNAGLNAGRDEGWNAGLNAGRNEGVIIGTVTTLRDIGMDDRTIISKIMDKYGLTQEMAESYVLTPAVM